MQWKRITSLGAVGLMVALAGCDSSTDLDPEIVEHQEAISEILPEEMQTEMEELGLEVHEGFDPPAFEGTYFVQPIFVDSNVPDDNAQPGNQFPDLYIRFSNQTVNNLRVDIDRIEGGFNTSEGAGGYVIGEGNALTVITEEIEEDSEGIRAEITMVYSAVITAEGLDEFHFAGFVRDNHGRPDIIPNNTGRLFEALGGLAEPATWPGEAMELAAPLGGIIDMH